jgi:hypothetical protein
MGGAAWHDTVNIFVIFVASLESVLISSPVSTEAEFDRIVDPREMVKPYVATKPLAG